LHAALRARDHTVDLWTTSAADQTFLPMAEVTDHQYQYDWPEPRSVPTRLPGVRKYLMAAALIEQVGAAARVAQVMASDMDRMRYDFVFAHHCQPVQGPHLLPLSPCPECVLLR